MSKKKKKYLVVVQKENEIKLDDKKRIIIKQFIIILSTSFFTVLFTQIFYDHNLNNQIKLEFEKETFISQIPIYNRVNSLFKDYELATYNLPLPSVDVRSIVIQDKTGNTSYHEEVKGAIYPIDTFSLTAPIFIFKDLYYDRLVDDLNYIKQNKNNLDPYVYIQVNRLFNFLEVHPIPNRDERINRILYHWSKEEVYTEYYKILTDLYNMFHHNIDKYLGEKNRNRWQ